MADTEYKISINALMSRLVKTIQAQTLMQNSFGTKILPSEQHANDSNGLKTNLILWQD